MPPHSPRTFASFTPGHELGTSRWISVTQPMISGFGDVTLDRDPMHVDPEWAAHGPFGTTISFGFLTLSLLTHLVHDVLSNDSSQYDPAQGYFLNYGFDRVRLITPVPVDSRIRGRFRVLEVRDDDRGRRIVKMEAIIELEHSDRPALVAEWLTVAVPPHEG